MGTSSPVTTGISTNSAGRDGIGRTEEKSSHGTRCGAGSPALDVGVRERNPPHEIDFDQFGGPTSPSLAMVASSLGANNRKIASRPRRACLQSPNPKRSGGASLSTLWVASAKLPGVESYASPANHRKLLTLCSQNRITAGDPEQASLPQSLIWAVNPIDRRFSMVGRPNDMRELPR